MLYWEEPVERAVTIYKQIQRQPEHEAYDQFSQGNASALYEEIYKIKMQTTYKEEIYLKSNNKAVEYCRHKQRQERDVFDAYIAKQIHCGCCQKTCDRAEDHVVEAESRSHGTDICDNTSDR